MIGDGHPIYTIADIGLTNGGDLERTYRLIDVAAEAGFDAVKLQMIGPDILLGDKQVEYTYPTLHDGPKTENMYAMFSELTYTDDEWDLIADYSRERELEFICTAHYMGAVPLLEKIGVNVHKICTWSMTHKRLVQAIGSTGKPLLLDGGAFTVKSLMETLDWHACAGGRGALILHDFHTEEHSEMNFRAIPYMKKMLGIPVGYTPQGRDQDMDFMSIGLGVNMLEKRLTLDRGIPKNGHIKALEPKEIKIWISRVKELELALGISAVVPTTKDIETSRWAFKSLYTTVDIKAGELIVDDMLTGQRPGDGIPANRIDDVCGRRAIKDIPQETKLSWDDLQ
jgi:sialic acid synthase SpsE